MSFAAVATILDHPGVPYILRATLGRHTFSLPTVTGRIAASVYIGVCMKKTIEPQLLGTLVQVTIFNCGDSFSNHIQLCVDSFSNNNHQ